MRDIPRKSFDAGDNAQVFGRSDAALREITRRARRITVTFPSNLTLPLLPVDPLFRFVESFSTPVSFQEGC